MNPDFEDQKRKKWTSSPMVVVSMIRFNTELTMGPMPRALSVLAGHWTLYLGWTLLTDGPLRFGELRRRVAGISSKVLTVRLRMLEREGFVLRRYEPSVRPRVTYEPTNRLRELIPVLVSLYELAERWYPE